MDPERARAFLLTLPHVAETMQWGENLVFWVADKAVGGKMFALINLDAGPGPVISFAATREHQAELCEREGLLPAPYLARAGWVAAGRWDALLSREWQAELSAARQLVYDRLPTRTRAILALPAKERDALLLGRRRQLAGDATPKTSRTSRPAAANHKEKKTHR